MFPARPSGIRESDGVIWLNELLLVGRGSKWMRRWAVMCLNVRRLCRVCGGCQELVLYGVGGHTVLYTYLLAAQSCIAWWVKSYTHA